MLDEMKLENGKSVIEKIKSIEVKDSKELFISTAKIVLKIATLQFDGAAETGIDMLDNLGLSDSVGEILWRLLSTALSNSLHTLFNAHRDIFKHFDEEDYIQANFEFDKYLKNHFSENDFSIDKSIFIDTRNCYFVIKSQEMLRNYLTDLKIESWHIDNIVYQMPAYFAFELNDEWRSNRQKYEKVTEFFDTPVSASVKNEIEWERYQASLIKKASEPVLSESFGLDQIYVKLNAYYTEKTKEDRKDKISVGNEKKIVIDLHESLEQWASSSDANDNLRIIRGGPGCGKSSFAKIFAAEQSKKRRVLFIPLHLIDIKDALNSSIGKFLISTGDFSENPYESDGELLVIFDGLDELTQQGKLAIETAEQFVSEVTRQLDIRNTNRLRLKVVITGRDLVIQSNESKLQKSGKILHILPYNIDNKKSGNEYTDKKDLLKTDKRDIWWENYGRLSGHYYEKLPDDLKNEKLDELTIHPLLNHLIALSYDRKEIEFTENTNLNIVYNDLINAVYERSYGSGKLEALEEFSNDDFKQILEIIAISAWQGSGRTATVNSIEERCMACNIHNILKKYCSSMEEGITNLLTTFYFRRSPQVENNERTFEFTHKSFGEYLISKNIIRELSYYFSGIFNNPYQRNPEETILGDWIKLCGKTAVDEYIFSFLCDEMALQDRRDVENWQDMIVKLIEYILTKGMPFEKTNLTFFESTRQSRNSEETLLAALSACSRVTGKISKINWEEKTTASNWITKLQCQRTGGYVFVSNCLNNMDFSNCEFYIKDFYGANLICSNLSNVSLYLSNLSGANLSHADLSRAYLGFADLSRAYLSDTNLRNAYLIGANLSGANLSHADLSDADLSDAYLRSTNLNGADLSNADLSGADLNEVKNMPTQD